MQTKHRNLQWTVFSSGNTDMLGKGEVHINFVGALNSRSGLCNIASTKYVVHVGAALVLCTLHAQNSLRLHS